MSGIGIRRYKPSGLGDYLRENFSRDRGIEETLETLFSYVRRKLQNRQLAKMGSLQRSKRSDNRQCTVKVM